jgi:mycothiol synthase
MKTILYRPVDGSTDAEALVEVHELCSQADGLDSLSLLNFSFTTDSYRKMLSRKNPTDWVIAQQADQIIGYGVSLWDWQEQDGTHVVLHMGWVIPAFRGQGIGGELLLRLEANCRQKVSSLPSPAARYEYSVNAEGCYEYNGGVDAADVRETSVRAFPHAHGYQIAYTQWEMARDISLPVELTDLPPGYELRPVQEDHERAIWQCIGDAYDVDNPSGRFRQIPTEKAYQSLRQELLADPSLCFIVWQGSRVAGQVLCRVHERNGVRVGEVYEVSIGHAHRRRGLARSLMLRGIAALHSRNVTEVLIYTMYEYPTCAWRLYEQVGFRRKASFLRWRKPLQVTRA